MEGSGGVAGAAILGYGIGAIPVGLLIGRRVRGLDVREHGSGSTGSTNVYRIAGPAAAVTTLFLDIGKGGAAVLLARWAGAARGGQVAAGVGAVVGHAWPVTARFRGGKGVATGFGGLLVIAPGVSRLAMAGGVAGLAATRIMSVCSLSAAGSALVGAAVVAARRRDLGPLLYVAGAGGVVAIRHAANLRRLVEGIEPRLFSLP